MKILKSTYLLLLLFGASTLMSCIRDEIKDCPPLAVNIAVKDKNYFNVDKVDLEDRKPDNLAFREYIPTLQWVLRDAKTGKVADYSENFAVTGDDETVQPDICPCVPHGKYVLTVWGGLDDNLPLRNDMTALSFHPGNEEGRDVYLTNDTLLYDPWHNGYTVEMERTKGKLIIEKLNLPANVDCSDKKITGIYSDVDNSFKYTGETHVAKQSQIETPAQVVTKTVLSPSLHDNGSILSMSFSANQQNVETLVPKNVNITMGRNELTVLRYVWDEERQDFVIYMLINDNWELTTKMEID